jgi:hypothetical protein
MTTIFVAVPRWQVSSGSVESTMCDPVAPNIPNDYAVGTGYDLRSVALFRYKALTTPNTHEVPMFFPPP